MCNGTKEDPGAIRQVPQRLIATAQSSSSGVASTAVQQSMLEAEAEHPPRGAPVDRKGAAL